MATPRRMFVGLPSDALKRVTRALPKSAMNCAIHGGRFGRVSFHSSGIRCGFSATDDVAALKKAAPFGAIGAEALAQEWNANAWSGEGRHPIFTLGKAVVYIAVAGEVRYAPKL